MLAKWRLLSLSLSLMLSWPWCKVCVIPAALPTTVAPHRSTFNITSSHRHLFLNFILFYLFFVLILNPVCYHHISFKCFGHRALLLNMFMHYTQRHMNIFCVLRLWYKKEYYNIVCTHNKNKKEDLRIIMPCILFFVQMTLRNLEGITQQCLTIWWINKFSE